MKILAEKIQKLKNESSSLYHKITWAEEIQSYEENHYDYNEELEIMKSDFKDYALALYTATKIFLERKKLPFILQDFKNTIEPYFTNEKSLFDNIYHEESGEVYNKMLSSYWSFLNGFEEFDNDTSYWETSGIRTLEHILNNTSVIIKDKGIKPTKETEVTEVVQSIVKHVFPDYTFPTQSFIKEAKHYVPDILVPSIKVAVEFKYALTIKALVKTFEEILIDVKGYNDNPSYNVFIAVFYVKPGIVSEDKFTSLWKEKKFPNNWKGILIQGV